MDSFMRKFTSEVSHSNKLPFGFALLVDSLSNIQIICFILKTAFYKEDGNTEQFQTFLGNFSNYIIEFGSPALLIQPSLLLAVSGYFMLNVSLLIASVALMILYRKIHSDIVIKVLSILYLIHSRIIFSFINYFLIQVISFQNDCRKQEQYDTFTCATGWLNLAYIICPLNIALSLAQELLFYSITKNNNAYAVKNNYFHQIILFQKIIAGFFSLIKDENLQAQISSAFHFLVTSFSLSVLYKKLPFYNMKILEESIITTSIALASALVSLLGILGVPQNALEVAWIFLSFFTIKICLGCFNKLFHQILEGKFDSPEKAIHFIILLKESKFGYLAPFFYAQKLPFRSILINGAFLHNHIDKDNVISSTTKEEFGKKVYLQSILYLEKTLENCSKSELLILFVAHLYLKKLKNVPKTILLLKKCQSLKLSIPASNSVEDFKNKLKKVYNNEYLLNSSQETLNLIHYFQSRANSITIKEIMLKEVEKHIEFWEELKKEGVDTKRVTDIARDIRHYSNLISKRVEQSVKRSSEDFFANTLILYGVYLDIIKENTQDAKKFVNKFINLNHNYLSHAFDIYSDASAVVIVPLEKDRFGRILDASGSAQGLFGMRKQQLMDQSLSTLLPLFVMSHLFKLVDNSLSITSKKMSSRLLSYAKTQNGNMFEVELDVHFYPEIEKEVKLMVFFRKISSASLIIVISPDGTIVECSETLKRSLNLPSTTSSVKLQQVLLDYERINTICTLNGANNRGLTKVLEHHPTDTSNPNIITPDGATKTKQDEVKGTSGAKGDLQEFNRTTSLHDGQKRQMSFYRTETRFSYLEKKNYLFSFIPLKTTDRNTQLTYNIEVKSHTIGGETYQVLTLMQDKDKEETSKRSSITNSKPYSNKNETESQPKEDEQLVTNKASQADLIVKSNKSQSLVPLTKKFSRVQNKKNLSTKKKLTERETSVSTNSSNNMMSIKSLSSSLDGLSTPSLKRINTLIVLIILFMACLGGINLIFSQKSLKDIETGIDIVNFTGLRLSRSMKSWQLATRFFLRYYKLRNGQQLPTLKTAIYQEGQGMIQLNKNLSQEISSKIQSDLLTELYKKDVRLWELYENNFLNNNNTDTFVATNLLANKLMFIGNTTISYDLPIVLNEIRYIVNNTGNDYLLSSEKLISVTQNILRLIIQDNILILKIMLGVESLALVCLCFCLLFLVKKILNSFQSLFKALVKIENHQIQHRLEYLQKTRELLTQDIETKQFGKDALDLFKSSFKDSLKFEDHVVNSRREPKLKSKGMSFYLAKVIGISLVVVQVTTVMFILSLTQSLSNFETFQKVNNQLFVTTKAGYRMGMVISIFYIEMLFRNETTMLVRNDPPANQVMYALEDLRQINNDLKSVFYGSESTLDPFVKELLEKRVCIYLSSSIQDYCKQSTQFGNTEFGILGMNAKVILADEYYTNLYFNNPTYNNAKSLIDSFIAAMRPSADTLEESYYVLNGYIVKSFHQLKDDCLVRITYLYLGIIASLVISLVIIEAISIKKIKSLDLCRGQILKTASCKILLENKAMKFYLNKHLITKVV